MSKAVLLTRCGCSRMVDIPDPPPPQWNVPLFGHYDKGLFRNQDLEDEIAAWTSTSKRIFELDRDTGIIAGGRIYIYREIT